MDEHALEASRFLDAKNRERINKIRAQGRKKWGMSLVRFGVDDDAANSYARNAVRLAVEAFWVAEDTELEVETHEEMDKYGRWAREQFPSSCTFNYKDGSYYQTCPLDIAHTKAGLSVGMVVRERLCAICGLEIPGECTHRAGMVYQIEGGLNPIGRCRVCGSAECSEHLPGATYPTVQVRIVMDADIEEVSIVRKPAQPLARFTSVPVDEKAIASWVTWGQPAPCNRCLGPCHGIQDPLASDEVMIEDSPTSAELPGA